MTVLDGVVCPNPELDCSSCNFARKDAFGKFVSCPFLDDSEESFQG